MFLLMAMIFTYMFMTKDEQPVQTKKPTQAAVKQNQIVAPAQKLIGDSTATNKTISIETDLLKIDFSSKGAEVTNVELKNYKTNEKKSLILLTEKSSNFNVALGNLNTNQVVFNTSNVSTKVAGNDSLKVVFESVVNGSPVQVTYLIKGNSYEIPYSLNSNAAQKATLTWSNELQQTENDIEQNRKEAKFSYFNKVEDEYDFILAPGMAEKEEFVEPINWFAFKQLYFNTGLINNTGNFETLKFESKYDEADSSYVKNFSVTSTLSTDALKNMKFYFGPNEYSILKGVTDDYRQNVYVGYDFVKPINRYIFVPMFNFFEKYIKNYGLLIILVVLAIKLVLTPLVYKSYISMAKTRVMAPEIEALRAKIGDDQAKMQQEQMKLYQQVGVNPLSGCVPALLQMPILMSVFFLFPNMIMFRQKEFLWSNDLSTYDAPIAWATNIPVIGNHLSLFAILYLISTLVYTYYNNQATPNQPGPVDMKKLSYVFPVVFFFVLNSFPAALNFYYFVSNLVTIIQQFIIRRFVDEDKIKAVLEENRKNFKANPSAAKKSRFSEFMEKSMKAAEEAKKEQEAAKKKKK
jgi:YidC/Oxa1 family membrane protein insertase